MDFDVDVSGVEERLPGNLTPGRAVEMLALRKAQAVAERHPAALIMGADTIVVLRGEVLGKPGDDREAAAMLGRLSGATHTVYTGLALLHPPSDRSVCTFEETRVTFAPMDAGEVASYVATGSPMDKAGGYGIQDDRGALFVRRIEGDYYNVVGLPLHRFYATMKDHFADLLACDEPE